VKTADSPGIFIYNQIQKPPNNSYWLKFPAHNGQ
jgi:hypothetical protein